MNLSARNCLKAVITDVKTGVVTTQIAAKVANGEIMKATITVDSQENLALCEGREVYFIFKAPSVIIAKDLKLKLSATNQLKCSIKEIKNGAINSEIVMSFGGDEISAVITNESVLKMALKVGDSVLAVIKASSVIIGVK